MIRRILVPVVACTLWAGALGAQSTPVARPGAVNAVIAKASTPRLPIVRDTVQIRETHWKRGALIGGTAASATWLLLILPPFIRGGDRDLGVGFLAATPFVFLLGAIPGALIGGQFPK